MGLISSIEHRSGGVNDPNMWINTVLESSNYATKSGVAITPNTALMISAVYACVTILAQTVASLPMTVNRRLREGGNEAADDHYLYPILHDSFNPYQTSYEAREMGVGHLKLQGNWYNLIETNGSGQITALHPLNPRGMSVFRSRVDGSIWYQYTPSDDEVNAGSMKTYPAEMIWHVKGFSTSAGGLTGLSTLSYARESMGLSMALRDFSAEFFGRKAVPGAVLTHPGKLSAPARSNLKESIQEYAAAKRHTTMILEEGLKWESIGVNNKDAQFLELSGAQVRDIARWFNVPLILLQEPEKVATYASVEQFMLSFAKLTIWQITRRIEQSANMRLLTAKERQAGYNTKLNLKGMLEGDFKSRMEGYRIGREGGWLSADQICALEDLPPLPDGKGKIYLQPLNYIEAGTERPQSGIVPNPDGNKDNTNG